MGPINTLYFSPNHKTKQKKLSFCSVLFHSQNSSSLVKLPFSLIKSLFTNIHNIYKKYTSRKKRKKDQKWKKKEDQSLREFVFFVEVVLEINLLIKKLLLN